MMKLTPLSFRAHAFKVALMSAVSAQVLWSSNALAQESCKHPLLLKRNEVHFSDKTYSELLFANPENETLPSFSLSYKGEDGENNTIPVVNGVAVISVKPSLHYDLIVKDDCGNEKVVGALNEPYVRQEYAEVSQPLMNALREWHAQKTHEKLSIFLSRRKEISILERLAYLQQHVLGGVTFGESESLHPVLIDPSEPAEWSEYQVETNPVLITDVCNCTINTSSIALPRKDDFLDTRIGVFGYRDLTKLSTPVGTQNPDFTMNIVPNEYQSGRQGWASWANTDGYWEANTWSKGAARYNYLETHGGAGTANQGKERQARITTFDSTADYTVQNNKLQLLNFFGIQVIYSCVNQIWQTPQDCGCAKTMDLSAHYDTKLKVQANTESGSTAKAAFAQAEDVAVLVKLNAYTGESQFLAGNRKSLYKNASSSLNPTTVTAAGNLLHGIGQIIGAANSGGWTGRDTSNGNTASNSALAGLFSGNSVNLGANLATMINSGPRAEEASGIGEASATLVTLNKAETINPNEATQYYLVSMGGQFGYGKFSWRTRCYTMSNAYLA